MFNKMTSILLCFHHWLLFFENITSFFWNSEEMSSTSSYNLKLSKQRWQKYLTRRVTYFVAPLNNFRVVPVFALSYRKTQTHICKLDSKKILAEFLNHYFKIIFKIKNYIGFHCNILFQIHIYKWYIKNELKFVFCFVVKVILSKKFLEHSAFCFLKGK